MRDPAGPPVMRGTGGLRKNSICATVARQRQEQLHACRIRPISRLQANLPGHALLEEKHRKPLGCRRARHSFIVVSIGTRAARRAKSMSAISRRKGVSRIGRKRAARQSKAARTTAKGREIVASLREAIEVEESRLPVESRFTVRTVELPRPAMKYDAVTVRATRDRLGVSQTIFAQLLGVSPMLVRAWEQTQRSPAMWARRLLDEVNRDPRHWQRMLRRAS